MIMHTTVHVCVGSAGIRIWNRGQRDCVYERDKSTWNGIDPMKWLLGEGRHMGAHMVVDSEVWQLVSDEYQTRELPSSLCIPAGEEGKDKMRAPPDSDISRFRDRMVKQTRQRVYQVFNGDHAEDIKIIRMLDKWQSGIKLFRQQAWRHARLKFQLIMDTVTDVPSTSLIQVIKRFEKYDVKFAENWRGLWSVDTQHQEIIHNYFQESGLSFQEQILDIERIAEKKVERDSAEFSSNAAAMRREAGVNDAAGAVEKTANGED